MQRSSCFRLSVLLSVTTGKEIARNAFPAAYGMGSERVARCTLNSNTSSADEMPSPSTTVLHDV